VPGTYEIRIIATDWPAKAGEPSFSTSQTVTIHALHPEAQRVSIEDTHSWLTRFLERGPISQMTGSPIHKDIFDITPDSTTPEYINRFVKGQDKIFLGPEQTDVHIERDGDTEHWVLWADAEKSQRLAIVRSQPEALTPDDFDAYSLDPSFADIDVTVHILPDLS
jgi:hypothetical protein